MNRIQERCHECTNNKNILTLSVHYVTSNLELNKISGLLIFVVLIVQAFQKLNNDKQELAKIETLSIMRKANNMVIQP
jgi:hypothetical protein